MRLSERILVATDMSQAADDAVKMASYLARAFESEVQLLYVIPPLPDVDVPSDIITEEITKYLNVIRQKLVDEGVQVAEPVIANGTPFVEIIDCAEKHDVNAIIVGSGEKDDADSFRVGITAERLERRSGRPVLVVKRGVEPPVTQIVCPVDFSPTSGRALREAIHLTRHLASQLTVFTVVQPLKSFLPRATLPAEAQQQHQAKQEARFEEFLQEFDFHGIAYEREIREGLPHQEILHLVTERKADLIVMGSVGRTGVARALLGSVAEKVARALPCSIMTVKSEDFVRLQLGGAIDDIREHVEQAAKLLENGFAREALGEFRQCIVRDPVYAPAWEGAAAAHERLENAEQAEECRSRAQEIVRSLWDRRIEAEIRSERLRWSKNKPYR